MINITADEIRKHLPMAQAIEVVQAAMVAVAEGKANLPLRSVMDIDGVNKLGIMPGAMRDPVLYGVKILSLFPGNPARGLSSHIGVVILFDADTGAPVVSMDADALTAIRTAAATAAATRVLARKDAQTLAIVGTGEQAESHIAALTQVRGIRDIRIAGRSPERAEAFVAAQAQHYPAITFAASPDVPTAVRGADIVCTVTSSAEVILQAEWIEPGTHVNAVGASIPSLQEIDSALVAQGRLFVDYKPSALAQARDIISAIDAGMMTEADICAEIGDVYRGLAAGRRAADEITVYRSLGIAAQDLFCADHVWRAVRDP
jgi:ornithine cyclodeaminase/alanine dehydrogenase-like protein (mu-crystallin family)